MSDEDAKQYINFLKKNEKLQPSPEREQGFIRRNGSNSKVFSDIYGLFAAELAEDWYERNTKSNISLGRCIRAANRGLLMATYRYVELEDPPRFKKFAKPFITTELDSQIKCNN